MIIYGEKIYPDTLFPFRAFESEATFLTEAISKCDHVVQRSDKFSRTLAMEDRRVGQEVGQYFRLAQLPRGLICHELRVHDGRVNL